MAENRNVCLQIEFNELVQFIGISLCFIRSIPLLVFLLSFLWSESSVSIFSTLHRKEWIISQMLGYLRTIQSCSNWLMEIYWLWNLLCSSIALVSCCFNTSIVRCTLRVYTNTEKLNPLTRLFWLNRQTLFLLFTQHHSVCMNRMHSTRKIGEIKKFTTQVMVAGSDGFWCW